MYPATKRISATTAFLMIFPASLELEGFAPKSEENVGTGIAAKIIKNVVVALILFVAGYMAWQRLQPLQYLHGSAAEQTVKQHVAAPEPSPIPAPVAPVSQLPAQPENGTADTANLNVAPSSSKRP